MKWIEAAGNPPRSDGDCRKLVWLVDKGGMGWVGIRAYHHGEGKWWINAANGGREESATVTHWMDLPQPPFIHANVHDGNDPLGLGGEGVR